MSRILQLEKIGIKDPKFVTVTRAFDFIMSILADNAGKVIVSVFPGKNGWFSISTTEALKDADYQNIISENEFLRALLDDIDALNIEITNKGYIYKCIAKCPISGTVLSKESYLDQDERKASITFRNGFDKSDIDEKELHKCLIVCEEFRNLCIIVEGQGSENIMTAKKILNKKATVQFRNKGTDDAKKNSAKMLEENEIVSTLTQRGLKNKGFISLESPVGRFIIKRYENLTVEFPCNVNLYSVRQGPNDLNRLADFICAEYKHLSWTDFHYKQPEDYRGDDPATLDQLCVFYRRLRQTKKRISLEEKTFILQRFYDLIYLETENFAKSLGVPFHKLKISNFTKSRSYPGQSIANTNCDGTINYNRYYLFHDAGTIRQVIVHELSHQIEPGHGKNFSKYYEDAMLELGLIPRMCTYSSHLCEPRSGARFPTGEYCPGYDFVKYIKGDFQNFLYDVKLKQCLSSNYSK